MPPVDNHGMPPEQWEARVRTAHLTLVRVLLHVRERLIAEGKLKPADFVEADE
jgi:hypothetical protein